GAAGGDEDRAVGVDLDAGARFAAAIEPVARRDPAPLVGAERLFVFGVIEARLERLDVAAMRQLWPVDHRRARSGGVLAAQFARIHADLFRQHVDDALDRKGGDRRAGGAI